MRTVMPPCAIILSMAACTGDIGEIQGRYMGDMGRDHLVDGRLHDPLALGVERAGRLVEQQHAGEGDMWEI